MTRIDTIERKITVQSPINRVWEAITVADHLASWFGDSAEVDLRPGGMVRFGWSEYNDFVEGVIEDVDPPTRFSYRWDVGASEDGMVWSTKVTFSLEEDQGTTTITVVESGLSQLPDELYGRTIEENSSGWTAELSDLSALLAGTPAQ